MAEAKLCKPLTISWTLEDSRQAILEGWDIFDCTSRYELEKNEERPGRFKDPKTDDDVVMWVIARALRGNRLAMKALLHLMVIDPGWTAADISSAVKLGKIIARDANRKLIEPRSTVAYRKDSP